MRKNWGIKFFEKPIEIRSTYENKKLIMDLLSVILGLIILVLLFTLTYVFYLLNQQKSQDGEQINKLSTQLEIFQNETQTLKDLLLTNFASSQATSKERFDYLDKSFAELNKVFVSSKRGLLGNSYLNELLGVILPKEDKVYQLEWTLQKKTNKGEGLRVDAVVFGPEGKNNLAIDSKFPLDNYLIMIDESKSYEERERAKKDFQSDCKKHIEKTSLYLSDEDSIHQAVMFIPSDAIYLAINDLRFYEIIELALKKKVWICSPTTLYIVLNQIILANRNWELHKNSEKILTAYLEIAKEFQRFDNRWQEVSKNLTNSIKKVTDFETTIAKIIKKNDDLQKFNVKGIDDDKDDSILNEID
jgi:DNA recombination protein RmuC